MKLRRLVEKRLEELANEPFLEDENGRVLVRVGDVYGAFGLAGFMLAFIVIAFAILFAKGVVYGSWLYGIFGSLGLLTLIILGDEVYRWLYVFYVTDVVNDRLRWKRITYAYLKYKVEKMSGLRR